MIAQHTAGDGARVSVIQMRPVPGEVEVNLATIEALARLAAADGADLIIAPETATTGYFIADRLAELAEPADGPSVSRLSKLASELSVYLAVGIAIAEGGRFYDAQVLLGPDGALLDVYRKVHLFSAERDSYSAGDAASVVETSIGKIGMSVCYDLIFPEFIRCLVDRGAEIVINSTNWITDDFQRTRWGWDAPTVTALAATRALENGVWVAMANCIGPELHFHSLGASLVAAPSGRVEASVGAGQGIASAQALYGGEDLARWREIATYLSDRRPDLYRAD